MIANRILANENVVDAYGHVSIRHPEHRDRYLLSRSRSPELVTADDIMTFSLDSKVVGEDNRPPYLERFIHGAIYAARPEIHAVIHSHASVYLDAMRMGEVKFLSDGEIAKRANWDPASPELRRAWEYWERRSSLLG